MSIRTQGPYFTPMREQVELLRQLQLTRVEDFFTDERLRVWRDVHDRQNCTLDGTRFDGSPVRLHVKRDKKPLREPLDLEAVGINLLRGVQIPTVELVAAGRLGDGRSFIATLNLDGHRPADMLLAEGGASLDTLLEPSAQLAARLHSAGLHHRDFYLNHLFLPVGEANRRYTLQEIKLIDAARVRPLPMWFARRWVVKDLAQFLYSAGRFGITPEQQQRWLACYAGHAPRYRLAALASEIRRKVASIARHDRALNRREPNRNVPIPDEVA